MDSQDLSSDTEVIMTTTLIAVEAKYKVSDQKVSKIMIARVAPKYSPKCVFFWQAI